MGMLFQLSHFVFKVYSSSINIEIRIGILGSSGSCLIRDLTSLVKDDQSKPLWCHLAFLGMTGLHLILWFMAMIIGRWSEFSIGSGSVLDVLVDQLQPQSDNSG